MNLFDALQDIRKRPGMYVPDPDPERALLALQCYVHGYEHALLQHGIQEPGTQSTLPAAAASGPQPRSLFQFLSPLHFTRKFADFLEARFRWSLSIGPYRAIVEYTPKGESCLERFWTLLEEYKNLPDPNAD